MDISQYLMKFFKD